jgi:hypothetical protein
VVKRPGRESDHSTLPGAEAENEWNASAPPTSSYATHSDDPIFSCRQSNILSRRACLLRTKPRRGFSDPVCVIQSGQLASSVSSHGVSEYFKTTLITATHSTGTALWNFASPQPPSESSVCPPIQFSLSSIGINRKTAIFKTCTTLT